MRKSLLALSLLCLLAVLNLALQGPEWPGPKPDHSFLLFNGWRLAPEGIQVPLPDTLPMNTLLDSSGKYLFILSAGYTQPSLLALDPANPGRAGGVLRVPLENAWLGMALNPGGDRLYVPEGNAGTVREFFLSETKPPAPAAAPGETPKSAPPGQLLIQPGRSFELFQGVANPRARGNARWVSTNFLGAAAIHPDGFRLYVADMQASLVYEVNLTRGAVARKIPVGLHPYRLLVSADGARVYVSNWGGASISVIDAAGGKVVANWQTGAHPSDMVADSHDRLLVACANTNSVYVHDLGTGAVREQIMVALHPKSPPGSTPSGLGLAPDGARLYVANSDNNAVAVVALGAAESRVEGFIPVGWYPTSVRVSADSRRLFVTNGRGLGSKPNPLAAQPSVPATPQSQEQYVARLQKGSLSIVDAPNEEQLQFLTKRAFSTSPYRDELLASANVKGSVIPDHPGGSSPIKYVMYIIKENRTYDQILGDMKEGNGDSRLALFGEALTPNHHKLAREFVLLDNFYVNSDVSADGHNWSTGALANDYVQKLWPVNYGGRRPQYDFEGQDPIVHPPGGYLWDGAAKAGVTYRSYGEYVDNPPKPRPATPAQPGEPPPPPPPMTQPVKARVAALEGHVAPWYMSFDTEYPDQARVDAWLKEFREYEKNGDLPRLEIIRLPNDHTAGTRPGTWTPRAMIADNDFALGRIVEAVSRSRYWKETAIFVLEDDAQNGPDHIDSHRSPGFVISPWIRRGSVDSTMYSTVSMLRTIGLILGLPPMTQYDAGATPMWAAFADKPDLRPYTAAKPGVDLNETNQPTAPGARQSARMDFRDVDRLDRDEEDELNAILWRAMKGNEPMPAPVRSAFPRLALRK